MLLQSLEHQARPLGAVAAGAIGVTAVHQEQQHIACDNDAAAAASTTRNMAIRSLPTLPTYVPGRRGQQGVKGRNSTATANTITPVRFADAQAAASKRLPVIIGVSVAMLHFPLPHPFPLPLPNLPAPGPDGLQGAIVHHTLNPFLTLLHPLFRPSSFSSACLSPLPDQACSKSSQQAGKEQHALLSHATAPHPHHVCRLLVPPFLFSILVRSPPDKLGRTLQSVDQPQTMPCSCFAKVWKERRETVDMEGLRRTP
ncbi:hypothetical protein CSOJ01_03980 [Colletotrichum sojae]|uniref:Uncharacterized protein n=1 Tax=Colletotrichum sojae TaxID=2175907 RepID=A0A8H6N016_9PEZI|nr:hypothetical protein CSOJ01_03980 [Colletotrichum sojae]